MDVTGAHIPIERRSRLGAAMHGAVMVMRSCRGRLRPITRHVLHALAMRPMHIFPQFSPVFYSVQRALSYWPTL